VDKVNGKCKNVKRKGRVKRRKNGRKNGNRKDERRGEDIMIKIREEENVKYRRKRNRNKS
jgi:hypothetical protein